jgi:ribosomal protein S27E
MANMDDISGVFADIAENRIDTWINELPPIQPKAKVGKWIVDQDAFSEINGYILKCHCSECNHKKEFYDHKSITTPTLKNVSYIYNYCPDCGAKMEVEE